MTASDHMKRALFLATLGAKTTSPNPMVGCVIVQENSVVGEGYHAYFGGPHAEINALSQAGANAKGATVYVTLEPCAHHGKTPPCATALIAAGVKKVVIATHDPNPLTAHQGIAALKAAGICVEIGLEAEAATELNQAFFHYICHQTPFVIAKWAMSFDGKTIAHAKDHRNISNDKSRLHTRLHRQYIDAILIGANTLREDNPYLTSRDDVGQLNEKQPLRFVLSASCELPTDFNLFNPALPGKTIIVTTKNAIPAKVAAFAKCGVEIWQLDAAANGQVDLVTLLKHMGQHNIMSLLIEGGEKVQQSFFNANLVNKVQIYLAPKIIATLPNKQHLKNITVEQIADDFYFTGEPHHV